MFLEISRLNWASRNLPSGERLPGVLSPWPGSIRIFMSFLATGLGFLCEGNKFYLSVEKSYFCRRDWRYAMSLKFVKFPDILLNVRDAFLGGLATSVKFGYILATNSKQNALLDT